MEKIDRKALAAKLAAGKKLTIDEVMQLNAIAKEEKTKADEAKNIENVKKFAQECSEKLRNTKFEVANDLKLTLRDMMRNIPGVRIGGNGAINPENVKQGSVSAFVVETLRSNSITKKQLVQAAKQRNC